MTAKELGETLINIKGTPLSKITTMRQNLANGYSLDYFNQFEALIWNEDNQDFEIKIPASEED